MSRKAAIGVLVLAAGSISLEAQAPASKAPAAAPGATSAAAFMKFKDVKIDPDTAKGNQIELLSWSWGPAAAPASRGSAVASAGKATLGAGAGGCSASPGTFSFTKAVDKASPALKNAAAVGTVFPIIELDAKREKYRFENALITSYQIAPMPSEQRSAPMVETVTIRIGRCTVIP